MEERMILDWTLDRLDVLQYFRERGRERNPRIGGEGASTVSDENISPLYFPMLWYPRGGRDRFFENDTLRYGTRNGQGNGKLEKIRDKKWPRKWKQDGIQDEKWAKIGNNMIKGT